MRMLAATGAALVAIILFAPVVCVTGFADGPDGGRETTRCTGLLPVPSNVLVMLLAAATAFGLVFWLMNKRDARRHQ